MAVNELLAWTAKGCRAALVIPFKKNAVSGKYELPSPLVEIHYDMMGDGNTAKMPKPSESKSEDTFQSYETASAQTIRMKINPVTLTLSGDTFKEESGSGTTAVYPEMTLVTGNTPKRKSGATAAARMSLKENIQMQLGLQKTVALIGIDMGKMVGGDEAGIAWALGTLGDVSMVSKGKAREGESLVFAGNSQELAITALEAISILPSGFPVGSEVNFGALAEADFTKLAAGELLIK